MKNLKAKKKGKKFGKVEIVPEGIAEGAFSEFQRAFDPKLGLRKRKRDASNQEES